MLATVGGGCGDCCACGAGEAAGAAGLPPCVNPPIVKLRTASKHNVLRCFICDLLRVVTRKISRGGVSGAPSMEDTRTGKPEFLKRPLLSPVAVTAVSACNDASWRFVFLVAQVKTG